MELAYIIYIPVYILNAEETHVIEVPGITLGRLKKVSMLMFTNIFTGSKYTLKIFS